MKPGDRIMLARYGRQLQAARDRTMRGGNSEYQHNARRWYAEALAERATVLEIIPPGPGSTIPGLRYRRDDGVVGECFADMWEPARDPLPWELAAHLVTSPPMLPTHRRAIRSRVAKHGSVLRRREKGPF